MVTRTAFGALPIQRVEMPEATRILRRAFDAGINFYDTARGYTDSEEKLGAAFSDVRSEVILATKSFTRSRDGLLRDLEMSLRNLKTDYVDILQLHNPETVPDPDDPDGAYAGLMEAKKKGMVRFAGITNHRREVAAEAIATGLFDTLQFPLNYLSDDGDRALVAQCDAADVGFIVMKAMSGGLITNARASFAWFVENHPSAVEIWGIQRLDELEEFIALDAAVPAMDDDLLATIETRPGRPRRGVLPRVRLLPALPGRHPDPDGGPHGPAAEARPQRELPDRRVGRADGTDRELHPLRPLHRALPLRTEHARTTAGEPRGVPRDEERRGEYPITNVQYPISKWKKHRSRPACVICLLGHWILDIGYWRLPCLRPIPRQRPTSPCVRALRAGTLSAVANATNNSPPVGLIAGAGRMPVLAANGILAAGRRLVVAGLKGFFDPRLAGLADRDGFASVGLTRMGEWIRHFHRHGVNEAVMIGSGAQGVTCTARGRLLAYRPDLRTARIWYGRLRHDKRDNAALLAAADELASEGIELMSSVAFCEEHLAGEGVSDEDGPVGRRFGPTASSAGRSHARVLAWISASRSGVRERDIIAVEAVEGTNAMIRRAGELCPRGGWVLVKVARPEQDMRFDVPTVGPETIRALSEAGCKLLVVEAGKTLLADKPTTLALADRLGVAVVGRKADAAG